MNRAPEAIPPTPEALVEAVVISGEIIQDIELSRVSISTAALKAGRLARLLNDFDAQQMFQYEVSGYPTRPDGIQPQIWKLLEFAGRTYLQRDPKTGATAKMAFLEAIEVLEHQIEAAKLGLSAAQDPEVSLSSMNPNQFVMAPAGNFHERQSLHRLVAAASEKLASRRALIHVYSSRRHYELKFSGVAQNVFSAVREAVDRSIGEVVPDAVHKFASVHENLLSENPEDWSNAVHSCRRILQDLADAVFPARAEPRPTSDGKSIKLGPDSYINRLVCYADDKSGSARFSELMGSHLHFLGDRLDAVFKAAQKGSHATVSRDEANRYVVYTYMLVGDILRL